MGKILDLIHMQCSRVHNTRNLQIQNACYILQFFVRKAVTISDVRWEDAAGRTQSDQRFSATGNV